MTIVCPPLHCPQLQVSLVDQGSCLHGGAGADAPTFAPADASQIFIEEREKLVGQRVNPAGGANRRASVRPSFVAIAAHGDMIAAWLQDGPVRRPLLAR